MERWGNVTEWHIKRIRKQSVYLCGWRSIDGQRSISIRTKMRWSFRYWTNRGRSFNYWTNNRGSFNYWTNRGWSFNCWTNKGWSFNYWTDIGRSCSIKLIYSFGLFIWKNFFFDWEDRICIIIIIAAFIYLRDNQCLRIFIIAWHYISCWYMLNKILTYLH